MVEIRERKTHNLRASNSSFRNSHYSILVLKLCPNFRLGEASTDIESSKIVVIWNFLDNSSKISSPISELPTSSLNYDCWIWWSLNVLIVYKFAKNPTTRFWDSKDFVQMVTCRGFYFHQNDTFVIIHIIRVIWWFSTFRIFYYYFFQKNS